MSQLAPGRPMEILLAEDDLEDAEMTTDALASGPIACRVHLVRNGKAALRFLGREGEFAQAPPADLLLLDMQMPKMGGHEVLTTIRGDDRWKSLPVIVMTGSRVLRAILEGERLGVDGYLIKPVTPEQFGELVESLRPRWAAEIALPS